MMDLSRGGKATAQVLSTMFKNEAGTIERWRPRRSNW